MTPSELNSFLNNGHQQPSIIAYAAKIELPRLVRFLSGDESALTKVEQESLDRFVIDEDGGSDVWTEMNSLYDALGDHVRSHSVAFLFEQQGAAELASGTLVKIGERVFVATAGHAVRKTQMLEFMGENSIYVEMNVRDGGNGNQWRGQQRVPVVRFGKHERYDVGFFEIAPASLTVLQRSAIELSQISVRDVQYGRLAFVFGYPSELKRERQFSPKRGAMNFASVTYANGVLAPGEWPEVPGDDRAPDASVDSFVRYSRDDEMSVAPIGRFRGDSVSGLPDRLPEAFGMSGGGFWQSWIPNEGRVWSPSNFQLFAIQSTWYEKGNYLRAIRIRHWLDLIAKSYPDLKPVIDEHMAAHERQR